MAQHPGVTAVPVPSPVSATASMRQRQDARTGTSARAAANFGCGATTRASAVRRRFENH
ncbi:hypothetical protein [Streptomyces sp. ATMOS53]